MTKSKSTRGLPIPYTAVSENFTLLFYPLRISLTLTLKAFDVLPPVFTERVWLLLAMKTSSYSIQFKENSCIDARMIKPPRLPRLSRDTQRPILSTNTQMRWVARKQATQLCNLSTHSKTKKEGGLESNSSYSNPLKAHYFSFLQVIQSLFLSAEPP